MASSNDDLINKLKLCRVKFIDIGINYINCSLDYNWFTWQLVETLKLDDDQNRLKASFNYWEANGDKVALNIIILVVSYLLYSSLQLRKAFLRKGSESAANGNRIGNDIKCSTSLEFCNCYHLKWITWNQPSIKDNKKFVDYNQSLIWSTKIQCPSPPQKKEKEEIFLGLSQDHEFQLQQPVTIFRSSCNHVFLRNMTSIFGLMYQLEHVGYIY